jgi:hypothetical protein
MPTTAHSPPPRPWIGNARSAASLANWVGQVKTSSKAFIELSLRGELMALGHLAKGIYPVGQVAYVQGIRRKSIMLINLVMFIRLLAKPPLGEPGVSSGLIRRKGALQNFRRPFVHMVVLLNNRAWHLSCNVRTV